ncbi:MAG: PAS domain-containing protein [Bryobacteraceae bacterium]|nr:PAS domain-containing protein [Bryobacteraceae bacterium]
MKTPMLPPDEAALSTLTLDSENISRTPETAEQEPEQEMARLRKQLSEFAEYVSTTKAQLATAADEQRASSEEISRVKEELEGINEKLGTTKDELRSAVQELLAVNEELQSRNHQLCILNDDLNNVLSAVNTPIVMVDRSLHLRRITSAAEEPLGLTDSDVGRPVADLAERTKIADIGQLVQQVIGTSASESGAGQDNLNSCELEATNREMQDHLGCWWSLAIRPYRTADNRIEGAVLTFSNIDNLKRSLQSAEESRDYADAIVDTVREPLIVLNPELQVERANNAFYRMFGLTRETTEGRLLYELEDTEWNIPQLRHALEEILPRNSFFQDFMVEHHFPRIGIRSLSLNARRIFQRGQKVRRILLAMEDLTERVAIENKLVRSNADLERFGYIIAHDLQEPLRTIGIYAQLIVKRYRGALDADADQFLHFVDDGVLRMQALIRDLLTYSQAGAEDRIVEEVNVEKALKEALLSLKASVEECNALVNHSDLPTIQYSSRHLAQVFQNLIGNALKYRSSQPPQIAVSAARGQREWIFSIKDNGIGFESSAATHIFDVFKRLHGREYAGTGIGLAICHRIVDRYGGRIWAESEPGVGSSFHFTIPAVS